ncbi:MAG: DUF4381 domain-containing protein [Pseudomonadales bacterium]|nr:DUF4381 domain-containing protein [Pseudomonadales bacterium]
MDSAELLEQLADIHLPQAVSFWPPAPGWWLLALLVLALLGWLVARLLQARRKRRICAFALQELDGVYNAFAADLSGDGDQAGKARLMFLNQMNAVLRRVALWHFPQHNVASLSGRAWVDFIREKGESSLMTDEIANALAEGRFQARCDVDVEQLHKFGERWIVNLYMNRSGAQSPGNLRA